MSHKATIGGRAVLLEASWLLPENEDISVSFKDPEGDDVTIKIEVKTSPIVKDSKEKIKPTLSIMEVDNVPVIQFIDWNSGFGSSTGKPVIFASTADNKIELSFLASVAKLSRLYRVEFQVMSEVKK